MKYNDAPMTFGEDVISDFTRSSKLEWIETNGLGGYASSTVAGSNSRKYHGLLVAALNPPADRVVLLSKLDETIIAQTSGKSERFELGCNQFPGAVHPQGYRFLQQFTRDIFPEFLFKVEDTTIRKTVAAIHGENTTLVVYEILETPKGSVMELQAFSSARDHHALSHANQDIGRQYLFDNGVFRTVNYHGGTEVFISVPNATFEERQEWYYNFEYLIELERGLEFKEDLYSHGRFKVPIRTGLTFGVIVSTDDPTGRNPVKLLSSEKKRREKLLKSVSTDQMVRRLTLAADQFIVKRGELSTIVAGYHWFVDWGRDTMISLPGLCLSTGRFTEAKMILQQYALHVSQGMLPNRFMDKGDHPEYNTIDATLWYFYAIYKYHAYTKDTPFLGSIFSALEEIVAWHYKGTRYNIHVDPLDQLLTGGEEGVQLTWMDAKVGGWVVTPRKGKAVEINALWYNALKTMAHFCSLLGKDKEAADYQSKSAAVRQGFDYLFWNESADCLFDFVTEGIANTDLRPNQVFAVSLPFPVVEGERAARILSAVTQHLLTPRGLRSLAPFQSEYKPFYSGDIWKRDGAYHQGTVWSFLLGPYVDALFRVDPASAKAKASNVIAAFMDHLDDAGIGTVSEIFDASYPHTPKGCIAQAWGVGEMLRVISEYGLYDELRA